MNAQIAIPDGSDSPPLELALVHDYLIQMGGAERVVAAMATAFPNAPIFTSLTDPERLLPEFLGREIHNTVLQRLPGALRHFKKLFALYPTAFSQLKIPAVSAVWISTSTFAKCVRVKPGTVTFCYCHNPPRFLWQPEEYLDGEVPSRVKRWMVRLLSPWLKRLDCAAARRMDYFIANSANVQQRIEKVYGRKSTIIYPPVDVERLAVAPDHEGYYLILSRLIAYKRIDLAIEAFRGTGRRLIIAGDGSDRARLQALAPQNVEIRGWVSDDERKRLLAASRALIFPGDEDFGIVPVEAQACGKPVIAFGKGGALETVTDGLTGVLFAEQTVDSLRQALDRAEGIKWDREKIRRNAERFSEAVFIEKMKAFMNEALCERNDRCLPKL